MKPVIWEGQEVLPWLELPLVPGDRLLFTIDRFKRRPKQFVSIAGFNCDLEFFWDGLTKAAHISASSKPRTYFVEFANVASGAYVRIDCSWVGKASEIEFGLGNAGVLKERLDCPHVKYRVRCSDGTWPVDFTCLVFTGEKLGQSDT